MLTFIIGGLYTVLVLALGGAIGYFLGSKRISEVAESVRRAVEREAKPDVESGSLKPYTKEELASMQDKAHRKMGEIFNGFRKD